VPATAPDVLDLTPWPAADAARYRASGLWRGETVPAALDRVAREHADRTALVAGDVRWTFAELMEAARLAADGLLALGLRAGDRIVVQLGNVPELVPVLYGTLLAGLVPVVALPAHREQEIGSFVEQTGARAYLVADRSGGHDHRPFAETLADRLTLVVVGEVAHAGTSLTDVLAAARPGTAEPVPVCVPPLPVCVPPLPVCVPPLPADPGGLALLQISGGSTGVPKLIPRTHEDYLLTARACAQACDLTSADVYLAALPATHNFPLVSPGVLGAHLTGAAVVLAPAPSPDVCFDLVERHGVTITSLVPPVLLAWLGAGGRERLSSLRLLQVGGARCSAEVARRVGPELGTTLQQMFGMAEGLICCTRADDDQDVIVHTQGRPVCADDELLVVDDEDVPVPDGVAGHLLVRGPYTIRGYYRAAEHNRSAFTADGFYRTGDVASRRPDGNIVIEGRAKDQINRGGEKVAAEEVENVLLAHPRVHDAVLVAEPDEYLGERTCAFVVPVDAADVDDPAFGRELRAHVRRRGLASYKVPDRVLVVAALPTVGIGKNSKRDLRQTLAAQIFAAS